MYHGGRKAISLLSKQFNIEVDYCDLQNLEEVEKKITNNTRLIWVETPSNPYLKIIDIRKIAKLSKSIGAITCVDNTWATPILQQPLSLGADLVLHSTTKYIGGHSDVQGGVLIPTDENEDLYNDLKSIQKNLGAVPSPFDCWLLLRSIPTLPLRIKAQSDTASEVAQFLEHQQGIEQVLYPGLKHHFNHDVASKQMIGGYGGMISVITKKDERFARKVANSTKLFKQATSLGGIESLIEHRASVEGLDSKTERNLIRLSIGIEDVEDLKLDLKNALE